jgi:predicted DNA-binding protein
MRSRVVPVSISMPPELAHRVRVLAARQDKSRSKFVCDVLEKSLTHACTSTEPQLPTRSQEVPNDA